MVGQWFQADTGDKLQRVEATTTYREDGTYELSAKVFSLKDGTMTVALKGAWRLQEGLLIVTVESESWGQAESPEFRYEKIVPGGKLAAGKSITAQLVSVSDTHLVLKDNESGATSVAERVR
ncbi:hypothetical protein R5W23_000127 [Gemmata sp. JC673]|uniref:Lipocalin-like domain-containing protein n=1 Tax=Gemmata algarum TaxID=2975278 RepID=A0ABU5ER05_9BACT|nr:hypothetical protein [Gemmata algarum]MDY3557600.1 hypothetical protein [Gemmata algarum]